MHVGYRRPTLGMTIYSSLANAPQQSYSLYFDNNVFHYYALAFTAKRGLLALRASMLRGLHYEMLIYISRRSPGRKASARFLYVITTHIASSRSLRFISAAFRMMMEVYLLSMRLQSITPSRRFSPFLPLAYIICRRHEMIDGDFGHVLIRQIRCRVAASWSSLP